MAKTFIGTNRGQGFLLPPNINDWLPQKHMARYIVDIVNQLDMESIYKEYSTIGKRGYDPKMLLSLLFYGYATGTFSSRKIENATYDSVAFRFISANTHPDHDTIANFRQRFLKELSKLFIQILLIAQENGILKIGNISLDGTKIKANASKHKALSYKHACALEKQLQEEVTQLMQKSQESDNSSIDEGINIPDEIARREDRLEVIKAAKLKIEIRAKERYEIEQKIYQDKIDARDDYEKKNGKKPKGQKPKSPKEEPKDKDQVNLTDEESRIMPTSGGGFIQAYNVQASVDHDSLLLVHNHVTQHTNDKQEIEPTLKFFKNNPQLKVKNILADAGYFSESNTKLCEEASITPYISLGKEKHNQTFDERFKESSPLKENPTSLERLQHRLQTPEGKALYAQRKYKIEPLFGVIKQVMGFRQFMLRGFEKAQGEWNLICITYNLKRMFKIFMA